MDDQHDNFKFGKTFTEAATEWKDAMAKAGTLADTTLVDAFASWLDRNKFLTPQLQLLAMIQARKVDAEFISALIDVVGTEKATEIAKGIHARYNVVKA